MLLVNEYTRDEVRIRVLACECELGCESRYIAFQARHAQLWVVLILVTDGDDYVDEAIDMLFSEDIGVGDVPALVEHYLALVGMTWPVLASSERACGDQHLVASTLPGWMLRLGTGYVWRTRRMTFGHDLIRVPRALKAVARYYEPDAPALEPWTR